MTFFCFVSDTSFFPSCYACLNKQATPPLRKLRMKKNLTSQSFLSALPPTPPPPRSLPTEKPNRKEFAALNRREEQKKGSTSV